MPIQQLPLMKGVGKDFRNADYIDSVSYTHLDVYKRQLMLRVVHMQTSMPNRQNQQQSPFSTRTQHLLTSSGLMVLLSLSLIHIYAAPLRHQRNTLKAERYDRQSVNERTEEREACPGCRA